MTESNYLQPRPAAKLDKAVAAKKSAVGYRKPPEKSQFKKGKSGNPKGRPKANGNIGSLLVGMLDETIRIKAGGKEKKVTKEEAMLTSMLNRALQGDTKALRAFTKIAEKAGALTPPPAKKKQRIGPLISDEDGNLRQRDMTPEEGRVWRKMMEKLNGRPITYDTVHKYRSLRFPDD